MEVHGEGGKKVKINQQECISIVSQISFTESKPAQNGWPAGGGGKKKPKIS